MKENITVKPFDNFNVLDGYHCQTNSLAKMYDFYKSPLSEDMLLGIGSGMGFMYWQQKGALPFLGGRGNNKNFHVDVGQRTGVAIKKVTTSSGAKAEKVLLETLQQQRPVMLFVDMGFLPYFDFGDEYHFGGHTHVVCGFDGRNTVLVSDMEAADTGLKRAVACEMTLEQLAIARGSTYKPFPPQNAYFKFDFANFRRPTPEDIYASIRQTTDQMLNPPIKNFGTKGIRKAGREIQKWEKRFDDADFRMSLFNIYLFVTVAGSGGGIFRYMYGRFLEEAAETTSNEDLAQVGRHIKTCGDLWTEMALPFKEALTVENPASLLLTVPDQLNMIADREEEVFKRLVEIVAAV